MNQPAILVKDLELIKDIMATSFSHFYNNDFILDETMDPLLSQNPFQAKEEKWKTHRSNMAPLFTPMKVKILNNILILKWNLIFNFQNYFQIKTLFPIITDICKRFEAYIQENMRDVNSAKVCT